jgi:biopolymer transport protein ExbD
MSASMSHASSAEPNLTPILDMVFQLITFFMLVVNFKSEAINQDLLLPVIGSARPVETHGQEHLLVLNIDAQGQLLVYKVPKQIEQYIASEAQAVLFAARREHPELQHGDELPTTVVIRCDQATPFTLLNRVIKACQKHGFRKFALMADPQPRKT